MFEALGKFSYRFRWYVIAFWVVIFAISVIAAPHLESVLNGGFADPNAPAGKAGALIEQKFSQGPTNLAVIFHSDTLEATSQAFQDLEKQALARLTDAKVADLTGVDTYETAGNTLMISSDGKSSVAVLNFSADLQTVQDQVGHIRQTLQNDELQTTVTGEPAVYADLTSHSFKDLRKVEVYGLPVALVALILVFGSLVAAALPVATGGLAVTVTLGAMYLIGRATSMSIFAMNVATLLGLAVAIDYALFIVWRFREELHHRGASVKDAVIVTVARAGRSVFYSGAAVMVGVVGLVFFPSPGLRSLGIGGALVVFFSVIASITFMPAVLSVVGTKVNAIPVIRLHEAHESKRWKWWSRLVLRRPWVSILVAVVLIGALAFPALNMKTQMTTATALPSSAEARQGLDMLESQFDWEALSPTLVLLTWQGNESVDLLRAASLFSYGQSLAAVEGVDSVQSPFSIEGFSDPTALAGLWPQFEKLLNDPNSFQIPAGGITLDSGLKITAEQLGQFKKLVQMTVAPGAAVFRVVADNGLSNAQIDRLVEQLSAVTPPAGYQTYLAGESAFSHDFLQQLNRWLPWVILWIVASSLVVFALMLRSVVLPALAVVVNLLTIAMSFGWLVILFQGDALEKVLHFTSTGAVDAINRVLMLCILFGITMDYAVFMLTRMHERWHRTGDTRESVSTGLVRSGRIIVSAALLVVIVTGAFAFTSIGTTKMLGLGIALAIIVDTLFVRLTLVPAVMAYLGKSSWWWPRLRRRKR
jgi:putative drug exporter of the RND superfamily